MKYVFPRIALADLGIMLATVMAGALLAGLYGVLHDEITYSISPEYFTKLKFLQFDYANVGLGDRVFAATIGFLASWWVGGIIAWFLARRLIPNQPRDRAYRQLLQGFACVFMCGALFAVAGYLYGLARGPDADYSNWAWIVRDLNISDSWAFIRVAYIHNASYLGGIVGFLIALLVIRPYRS